MPCASSAPPRGERVTPITVRFLPENRVWRGEGPAELFLAAATCDILVEQPCGSKTVCGKCRVRVLEGDLPPGPADLRLLGPEATAAGWRLGCRLLLYTDATIEIPPAARAVAAKSFGDEGPLLDPPGDAPGYGLAIDVGSTTLAVALVELAGGAVLATASQLNPQVRWGGDVISRIHWAQENPARARELHDVLLRALDDLAGRCLAAAGVERAQLRDVAAVGNPTMLHTLLGLDPTPLGQAPYEGVLHGAWRGAARALGLDLPETATAYVLPGVRSHVGADTVAALLAAGIDHTERPRLLIDLGTNSEVVLGCRDFLLCTSTSAGPAFEGAGIHQGMRAAPGAIDQLRIRPTGSIMVRTIGGEDAVGVCGSGLIDAVAELVRAGVVEPSGRLRPAAELSGKVPARLLERLVEAPTGERAVWLAGPADRRVLLTAGDIRQLQLVKGSIAAGVRTLLDQAGLCEQDLDEVLIAGAFGNYLRKESAQAIGLVPRIDPERVRFVGNAAGAGARLALVSPQARERAERLACHATFVELADHPGYHDAFVAAMAFPPPAAGSDTPAAEPATPAAGGGSGDDEEERRQRVLAARSHLLRVLGVIAAGAAEQALERCPYRTREDVCTFRGSCRNQVRAEHAPRRCAGGPLNPEPAEPTPP